MRCTTGQRMMLRYKALLADKNKWQKRAVKAEKSLKALERWRSLLELSGK
jgi:hypothetical protein